MGWPDSPISTPTLSGTPSMGPNGTLDAQSHSMLGFDCFVGDLEAAASVVVERAASEQGGFAVLCNAHVLSEAQRSAALRKALERAWVVFPDGAPVAWLQRQTGAEGACRIAGPDLMPAVMARGRELGLRHFLYGSKPSVVALLRSRLQDALPGVEIAGAFAPAPGTEHSSEAVSLIELARPDVVWVALGAPRQELWMLRHAKALEPAVILGIGAAFEFHAGTKHRAPQWLQDAGLEWLHRLASEPLRLGPRYLRTNSEFLLLAGRELTGRKRQG